MLRLLVLLGEMTVETIESTSRSGATQRQVEIPDKIEPFAPLLVLAADQRMLEQCQQRNRRQVLGRSRRDRQQQRAGCKLGQRLARAVVRRDSNNSLGWNYPRAS